VSQLETFSRHSDENALRAESEKLRREQETRAIPDGYENADKLGTGAALAMADGLTTSGLTPPVDLELLSASSPLDHTPSALTPDSRKLYCLKALLGTTMRVVVWWWWWWCVCFFVFSCVCACM
jgi:hypothetical protein